MKNTINAVKPNKAQLCLHTQYELLHTAIELKENIIFFFDRRQSPVTRGTDID